MDRSLVKKLWALSVPVRYIQDEYSAPATYCKKCGAAHDGRYVAFTRPVVEDGIIEKVDLIAWCQDCEQHDIFFRVPSAIQDAFSNRA